MKKREKLWAIALALVLMVSLLPGRALAEGDASAPWTDYAADSFDGGAGTQEDPYQIATAGQLAKLALDVNQNVNYDGMYFVLTDHIDLSAHRWVPIGTGNRNGGVFFKGHFDGGSHTIGSLSVEETSGDNQLAGLFGGIASSSAGSAAVKDLTILATTIKAAGENSAAGILAGSIEGSGTAVTNCSVFYGTVTSDCCAGGLAGHTSFTSYTGCHVVGATVTGTGNVGGFVGDDFHGCYEGCTATGAVSGSWSLGGFAGSSYGDAVFNKCEAGAAVTADNWHVGGFIGYMEQNVLIKNCVATGNVESTVTAFEPRVGGFAGANGNLGDATSTIQNCHASGIVTSSFEAGGFLGHDVGGVIKECSYNAEGNPGLDPVGTRFEGVTESAGIQKATAQEVKANICMDYNGEHAFGEWQTVSKPQNGQPGEETRTCTACNTVETREKWPDLQLNAASADEGDLDTDGYHWDAASHTLTLKDSAKFGTVILPGNVPVTVVTSGDNHFGGLGIKKSENGYGSIMNITISGSGTLTVDERIGNGVNGDALTIEKGAALVAKDGIAIGGSGGVDSTVTVKGKLTAVSQGMSSTLFVGKVAVESTGVLSVSGQSGVALNGMPQDSPRVYEEAFVIREGGAFHADCSEYAVCVYTAHMDAPLTAEDAQSIIVLPDLYLPVDYERKVIGTPDQYGITIAEKDANTSFGTEGIIDAAGKISLAAHAHVLTQVPAKAATCTEDGNEVYWTCSRCNRYYEDAAGTTETTKDEITIAALKHSFGKTIEYDDTGHWHICDRCGAPDTPQEHQFINYVSNNDATCTQDGTKTATCESCQATNTMADDGSKKPHTLTRHEAKSATCTSAGNVEYYSCSACGKNYADEAGSNVLDKVATDIDPNKHPALAHHEAQAATCIAGGIAAHYSCPACGKVFADADGATVLDKVTTPIDPDNHALVHHAAQAPTCTADGNIEYWRCSACGKFYSDAAHSQEITEPETVIKATGHPQTTLQNAREATCTQEGYTGDQVCTVCGAVVQRGMVISMLDHDFQDGKCAMCGLVRSESGPVYYPDVTPGPSPEATAKPIVERDNPQTGDHTHLMAWIIVMLASAVGMAFLAALAYGMKRKQNK